MITRCAAEIASLGALPRPPGADLVVVDDHDDADQEEDDRRHRADDALDTAPCIDAPLPCSCSTFLLLNLRGWQGKTLPCRPPGLASTSS